jgi:hypothetical protein
MAKKREKQPERRQGDWRELMSNFRAQQGDWWERFASDQPLYTLPCWATDALAKSKPPVGNEHRGRGSLLSARDAEAERAFTSVCESAGRDVVGVYLEGPLRFEPLTEALPPALPPLSSVAVARLGWPPEALAQASRALRSTQPHRDRCAGGSSPTPTG